MKQDICNWLIGTLLVLLGTAGLAQQKPGNPGLPDPDTPAQTQQSTSTQSGSHSSDTPQSNRQPDSQMSAQENGQDQMSSSNQQTFLGTVEKTKRGYVLRDRGSNASFNLDRPDLAQQFEGKQVKVTGKLDSHHTIHVVTMEPAG